jgi:serine/threonine-protein kinase
MSDGTVTIVSSWAAGEGLDAALGAYGPAAIGDAVERLTAIAAALDLAATRDIWHGALHPADVLVSATDTHVTGLGVAQVLEKAHVPLPVRAPYTAPEVIASRKSSPRADQFALAAMAHEWLFGAPITGPAEWAMDVPRLPDVNPAALSDAFTTALAPDPAERFVTCASFVDALRVAAATAPAARAASTASPFQGDLLDEPTLVASAPLPIDDLPIVESPPPVVTTAAAASESTVVAAAPTRASTQDRAPVVEEKTVAWRGEMAALSAAASREGDRRGLSATALVAVFVVGLALGGAGGYVVAQRRASAAPAPRASAETTPAETVAPERPAPDATTAPGRAATEAPVPAAAKPTSPPDAARTESAAANPPAPVPPTPSRATPTAGAARLLVRSTPGGATVTVDGVDRGTTPLVLRDLPIGTRRVTIARRGYTIAERSITLSGDRPSRSIEVTLVPIAGTSAPARPAPATSGALVVESRPSGAAVTLDGNPAGTTPLTIASVAPGRHTVVITAQGMKPVTSTVVVKAGERARVAATLVGGQQD